MCLWQAIVLYVALIAVASAQDHSITITGREELFLSHSDMNCGSMERGSRSDITDMAVSAFRRKDGSVVVLAGNQNNYYLEGRSVDKAQRTSCRNLLKPVNDPDPSHFTARRWLMAIYAKDYDFVLGYVHNEYHGSDFFPQDCKLTSRRNFECWYASTGLVVSRDGGFTFETPQTPDNVLAAPPYEFERGKKRVGINTPKVVGNPRDGMVYVMVTYLDFNRNIRPYQCLLRGSGQKLSDWRGWDGKDFTLNMASPYVDNRSGDCSPVLPFIVRSLRYVPAIDRYVAIGIHRSQLIYVFSKNLISWSQPKTLMDVPSKNSGNPPYREYFSLLDSASTSINFDTLEGRPYLYFVQFGEKRRARDVYRVPIAIN
jgi:hypothetical protein